MIAQCLYQSDPKNLASMGRQRLACQRAARKLQWGVPNGRHYAPLPRLPWQEDDVAEVPQ